MLQRLRFRGAGLAAGLALFTGNLLVAGRFLTTDFSAQVWNNEYAYISLAATFRSYFGWNPLWYGGMPLHYAYPPLFPALMVLLPVRSPALAFHVLSALVYALTPVVVYWLCLRLFDARAPALLAAAAYSAFPSPLYLIPGWHALGAGYAWAPYSFVATVGYTAGPNLLALVFALLAVGLAWRERWLAASVCAAGVFLSNWSSAAGLVILLLAVTAAKWWGRPPGLPSSVPRKPAASRETHPTTPVLDLFRILALGYGFAAFWLTAGALRTSANGSWLLRYGEHPPAPWRLATVLSIIVGAALICLGLWRRTSAVAGFLLLAAALTGVPVVAYAIDASHVLPLPWRFALELNAVLVLAGAWLVWVACRRRPRIVALVIVAGVGLSSGFLRKAWSFQTGSAAPETLPAFQITQWLATPQGGNGGGRVFVTGELKQALNAWSNVPQVAGAVDQSAANPLVLAAHREVSLGCNAEAARLWLAALDCRYVVTHGAASHETYHWFVELERFSAFPLEWSNGAGDEIRAVPVPSEARPSGSASPGGPLASSSPREKRSQTVAPRTEIVPRTEAVVVDKRALASLPAIRSTDDLQFLRAYVEWARGLRPAAVEWLSPGNAQIQAAVGPDEAVLVKVNYDAGWTAATANGRASVEADPIGFLLVSTGPTHEGVTLGWRWTFDLWLGCAVTLVVIALVVLRRPFIAAAIALLPLALAFTPVHTISRLAIAEEAFRRLQPPLIAPGGITVHAGNDASTRYVSISGRGFDRKSDRVRLWVNDREAHITSRSASQLEAVLPPGLSGEADFSVEVNGCRGNAFRAALPE